MAKKSSGNAVKKIDEQIKMLDANSKDSRTVNKASSKKTTSTTRKSTTTKKTTTTRDKVVVAPTKKKSTSTTTKKTSTSKNIRGGVVAPKKKNTTKTITKEKIKNELQDFKTKKDQVEVVVDREKKKELESEVNKILEIEDSYPEVEIPKFIQEDKPEVEETKEDLGSRVKDFLEKEDEKESLKGEVVPTYEKTELDDVNVIKFNDRKPTPKSTLKKKEKKEEIEDLKLEKPIDLDHMEQLEEYKIVEEFEKDIPPVKKEVKKQQEFTRKRKGKGYVVTKKPTYHELEKDLRGLYDKVEDVVDDFDEMHQTGLPKIEEKPSKKKFTLFGKKEKTPKTTPVKTPVKKPVIIKPTTPVQKPVVVPKKKKVVREIEEIDPNERPSLLDHISQKVLNFFLIVLFTIFFLMTIAFIGFVIYVSTF